MLNSIFPLASDVPEFMRLEKRRGRILIGGEIQSSGFPVKEVVSPCPLRGDNGETFQPILGETPNVGPETFAIAVEAAVGAWAKGLGPWPSARMESRIVATTHFRDRLLPFRETVAKYLSWEIAKPFPEALAEFDRTVAYINDTLEAVKQLDREGSRIHFAGGIMAQIRRMPLGVTLCIGPFNYPLNETFTTLIPALLMGNTVVVKTPRFGQLFWDVLLEAFAESFPPGVINIVSGMGRSIIGASVQRGKIDVLALIGSSKTANTIKQSHPQPNRFRAVLGLDAKNPAIVLPDANLETAVAECLKGSLSFNGQRCTALKILFVHRSIADAFTKSFSEKADGLKAGLPWEPGVSITPLPHPGKVGELKALIDQALSLGAQIANPKRGGQSVGNLLYPTVLQNVPLHADIAHEEQFGPVVPIVEYDSLSELESYLLDSPYGMQASIFGEDPEAVGELIDLLSNLVCRINLNSQCQRGPDVFPFTGRKASAEGTLSVADALRCFSIRSMVATKQDEAGKTLFRSVLESDSSQFLSTNIVL
jgi:glyceraldehyde-3-phosphate dehydrogenase (NADP+)